MVVLRSDYEVNRRRPADDFSALSLRNAAGDGDEGLSAGRRGRLFQAAHAAKLGIDLLRRFLANVAGVEDDQVGVFGRRGFDIAFRRQRVRHTLGVVNVHLAAKGFYEELARTCHSGRI